MGEGAEGGACGSLGARAHTRIPTPAHPREGSEASGNWPGEKGVGDGGQRDERGRCEARATQESSPDLKVGQVVVRVCGLKGQKQRP